MQQLLYNDYKTTTIDYLLQWYFCNGFIPLQTIPHVSVTFGQTVAQTATYQDNMQWFL